MSYLHLASNANTSSSSTPSSFFNVNSNGGVSTVPTSLSTNSSSLLGSIGGGKQWTTIGQPSSSSPSSSLSQQLLMKQPNFLNMQSTTSSHFDNILGSSSQTQLEKNFELQQEDFPPLPHRNNFHESSSSSSINVQPIHPNPISSSSHQTITNGFNSSQQSQPQHSQSQSPVSFKSSIDALSTLISRYQVSTNNTNKPSSTITDQYGLVGLLQMIQQAEKNPDSSMLLNFDLTTLGLSMESTSDLHPSFISPFSDNQARAYEIDYQVPVEYQMGMQIREKLPQVNFSTLNEDTLFFLFYLFGNDYVQLSAANELYKRDWRYHKEERIWLTRIKNIMPDQKYDTYETGVYCVFDVQLWRKTHKSMRIDYDKLDGPVVKQHPDVLASKLLQQQYAPMTSYNTNTSR
ncbi:unnamed protein product [Rotaria socialis]|uniref:NOT2/NOT3/NOT5 C-terminal domain-containing protein n=4 Tax=Rotaria socialis TaxID=392032 RepID=A0A820VLW2_9BILA|nr:unnamed protein product [Rotaria socialis]CAF3526801.1 unnamed protein product [Rotaria socialis]CAF3687018.1 unnamed protein product [Rotaria socialis]CAF3715662.1 unnamed protein product [Rotaria socialis]CAF3744875.1 unnamed protein product [Rotaria socialis]